jgi:hypothetical protein
MAILMKYGSFRGDSAFEGFEGYCILDSVSWGYTGRIWRGAGAPPPAGKSGELANIVCGLAGGSPSAFVLSQSVGGPPQKVEIVVTTFSGQEGSRRFLTYELERAQVVSYSTSMQGERQDDSFTLHYRTIAISIEAEVARPDGRVARIKGGRVVYDVA